MNAAIVGDTETGWSLKGSPASIDASSITHTRGPETGAFPSRAWLSGDWVAASLPPVVRFLTQPWWFGTHRRSDDTRPGGRIRALASELPTTPAGAHRALA